jgi:predicted PurR-regulated permease PerM
VTSKEAARSGAEPAKRPLRIEIGWRTMVLVPLVAGGAWLLIQIWTIILVIVVALMLVGAVSPAITWLEKKRLSRGLSIAAVFVAMFGAVVGFCAFTIPRIGAQVFDIVKKIPAMQDELVQLLQRSEATAPLANTVRNANMSDVLPAVGSKLLAYSTQVMELVAYAVTTCFLALYLVIDRDRMRGSLFALVPRHFHLRMSRILLKLETIVGGYVRGQVITSILMAIFTFVVLLIARATNASALAAFAGVADVLPYIGGILASGPAVVASTSHGASTAIGVAVALLAYQEFESRVIVPRVYGDALRLSPSVVLVSLLIGGTLMGVLGALLALPIAAGIRMLVEELQFELPGEDPNSVVESRVSADERVFARRAKGENAEKAAEIATEIATKELVAEEASRLAADPVSASRKVTT